MRLKKDVVQTEELNLKFLKSNPTMKKNIMVLGLLLWSIVAAASFDNKLIGEEPDSLVHYKGIIVEEFSGKGIAGVSIKYKKMPYQSEIGLLTTDENGEFEAYFRARESYSIQIKKEGYTSFSEVIHPLEGADGDLKRTN